jgi:hypothetical protein
MAKRHGANTFILTPKMRASIKESARGVCWCTDRSHKGHQGGLQCGNELEDRLHFYCAGFTMSDPSDWILVCRRCAEQIRSLGGKIYM